MKTRCLRFFGAVPVALALFLFVGCSGIQKIDTAKVQSVDLSSLEEEHDLSILVEMAKGKPLKEPVVMKLPKGFRLPVHLTLNSPLAQLDSECGTLIFSQDFFLYLSHASMLVSPDRINWANMADFDAVKELFGWGGGNLALGIGATRDQGAFLEMKIGVDPVKRSGE